MRKLSTLLAVSLLAFTSYAGTITFFSRTMIKTTINSSNYSHRTAESFHATYKLNSSSCAEFFLMDEGYYGASALARVYWGSNMVQGTAFVYKSTNRIYGASNGTYISLYMYATPSEGKAGYAKSSIIGKLHYGSISRHHP